ncbi:bifunctional 3-(3-hydroxy-phenyl)propionate/3-hydroxycinnamic acid hydroxylase [Knoellia sp. CPCC 206453]|uniref:bifunctional 3-(3-hydroxy-phenyl)propionate/3-hydroxycinnamic acid hydroxylase MhpA n=1 Tax=Knoellia pratensis TaxID=3404796 RepID=UPI0036094617
MDALRTEPSATTDCVVVGAGPVGLTTALLLGREGWRVTVVERWPEHYPLPRACTIDHEALRILQAAGLMAEHAGLFEPSQGGRGGYQMRNADGELLRAINWNRTAESGWANTNGFYQPDLEQALEEMVSRLPGVEVCRGWTVTDLAQSDQSVLVTLVATDDETTTRTVTAPWTVAADGANSPVRQMLGIESVDSGFEADWLVVDYEPIVDRDWDAFVTQYCDPAQPATAVNSGPGRRRFEFMRRADVTAEELARTETAWRLMSPWGVTPENARLERHAVYTFRGRWTREWRSGRVFLAGDAAHLMPPFLGQGLCAGLRDARALTWRLDLVRRGLADESVLDSYGSERRQHVREIIEEAVSIGRVICELDPVRAADRDAAMRAQLADPDALTVEPPHPRLGEPSITRPSAGVEGRLSVQGRVEVGGRTSLLDDVVGASWQLIGLDVDPTALATAEQLAWFAELGGTVTSLRDDGQVRDVDGTYAQWFRAHGCTVVLARPDFYVYAAGRLDEVPQMLSALRATLTTTRTAREVVRP